MTRLLNPNKVEDIETAGEILRNGGLVAIPTETVYGLAANALNPQAVTNIYKVKGRPSDNPLIVHISDFSEIYPLVKEVPESARKLAAAFWPGPLTIILPKTDLIPSKTSGGLDTVAVRFPSHKTARDIIKSAGCPLAAPSANLSGKPSPTDFKHVFDDLFGKVEGIVDGGICDVGLESTVITLVTPMPKLLRPGGVSYEDLCSVLGEVEIDDAVLNELKNAEKASSPGMKYKHYSPSCEVTILDMSLNKFIETVNTSDASALCFEGEEKLINKESVTYGKEYYPVSQAKRLFTALYELDEKGIKKAYARMPKRNSVGLAVYNRLIRSAGFKIIREKPMIIGLTGQTGAGKTLIAEAFKRAGAGVIDCDRLTRSEKVYDSDCIQELINQFGNTIINEDNSLNRRELARIAFSTKEKTEKLNSICFPKITEAINREIGEYKSKGFEIIILDAPTLFEAKADRMCTKIIAVTAPETIRIARIISRDNISYNDAKIRIDAQKSQQFFEERADYVVNTAKNIDPNMEIIKIKKAFGSLN